MSPDGHWLAYTSDGRLKLTQVAGGAVSTLGPPSRVFSIAWLPDSRHLAAFEVEAGNAAWWLFDAPSGERQPLWNGAFPKARLNGDSIPIDPRSFREVAWSPDGERVAAVMQTQKGFMLWTGKADGSNGHVEPSDGPLSSPTWMPDGKTVACLLMSRGSQHVSFPCGTPSGAADPMEAYGRIAFSADRRSLYFASPSTRGTLDLWVRPISSSEATRLTSFSRDTYAPSVATNGRVVFGVQDYRAFIAAVPSGGGPIRQLTTFQSETPTWSRDDRSIGFTYGSWRRFVDDIRYPDIAQDLGVVRADAGTPAKSPLTVIRASTSEDQGLDWSPNGRWIVLHSHANRHDDVWIQPADGSVPARPISSGGYETGWPRWSPNGGWIAYSSQVREGYGMRGALFTIGIDSASGTVTREARRVPLDGIAGDIDAVEWSATSDSLVFTVSEGPDRRAIYVAAREGGKPRLVHRYTSEQDYPGIGVSPDFRWVAYIAPAADGHFQVFRVALSGGTPTQVTFDPTDKTQPAVSRSGASIAFTVFSYQMRFWTFEP
jgi:Tol biopolymer transport system component